MKLAFKCIPVIAITAIALILPSIGVAAPTAPAQHGQSYPDQSTVASKATFAVVPVAAAVKAKPIDAKNLAAAQKLIGENGAFQGTVSGIYAPSDHDIVVLDFDPNYRTALTAVVKPASYAKFPSLASLTGKRVLVVGKFIDYHGKVEIELTSRSQVKVIR